MIKSDFKHVWHSLYILNYFVNTKNTLLASKGIRDILELNWVTTTWEHRLGLSQILCFNVVTVWGSFCSYRTNECHKLRYFKNSLVGPWNGSGSDVICHKAWPSQFYPWNPHSGKEEPTLRAVLWLAHKTVLLSLPFTKMNKWKNIQQLVKTSGRQA